MLHAAHAPARTRTSDCDHDTAYGTRKAGLAKHGLNFLLHSLWITQGSGMESVEVYRDIMVGGHFRQQRKHCLRSLRELRIVCVGGEKVDAFALMIVFGGNVGTIVHHQRAAML